MAALAQTDVMETAVRSVMASSPAPEGVVAKRFCFAEDHAGDPAVFVLYAVSPSVKPIEERAGELAAFRRSASLSLWNLGLPLVPYIKFVGP